MGQNSKYYGIRFDRRSQNFGFHMIARSQLIADDRRGSQTIAEDRTWFYLLRSSAIVCDHDRRIVDDRRRSQKCVSIWSQTIAELFAICDPRSAIVCDHMETSLKCRVQVRDLCNPCLALAIEVTLSKPPGWSLRIKSISKIKQSSLPWHFLEC